MIIHPIILLNVYKNKRIHTILTQNIDPIKLQNFLETENYSHCKNLVARKHFCISIITTY
jgi:hypothetical protein